MSDENSATMRWMRERMAWLLGGRSHNGLRNYNVDFGYPLKVSVQDMRNLYKRDPIAVRIIRAFPAATWEEQPVIRDGDGDSEEQKLADGNKNPSYSPFVASVNEFMRATNSLRYLERVDRLSGIGRFGILVMGFQDGQKLNSPRGNRKAKLLYLQAWGEPNVEILRYDADQTSPRYGMPLMYRVTPGKDDEEGRAPRQGSYEVHYSRVLHVSEFLDDSEVLGAPRLEAVYNSLLDLEKTLGAGAEAFYRLSNPGLAFTADADAKIDPTQLADMKEQVEEFENQMRRVLALQGVTPHTLGSNNAKPDPAPEVDKLLDIISGGTGIPKRLLIGSERGELASSQDADSWASRIDERQNNYAGPAILLPFVQAMVDTGNVQAPKDAMSCVWPDSGALSPKDQAEVGRIRAEALAKYAASPNAEIIVPMPEFRRDFLQLPPESEYEPSEELDDLPEGEADEQGQLPAPDGEDTDGEDENLNTNGYLSFDGGNFFAHGSGRAWLTAPPDQLPRLVPLRLTPKEFTLRPNRLHLNAAARTLYVRRDLLNADAVRKYFKGQGLDGLVEDGKMHVTVMFSRTPVDWFKMGEAWTDDKDGRLIVKSGGARLLDLLGPQKEVLVLLFASSQLSWRHEDMKMQGCSWDYPDYQPHISLTWNLGEELMDRKERLEKLTPFTGELVFGPEIFEEVKVDWQKTIKENSK